MPDCTIPFNRARMRPLLQRAWHSPTLMTWGSLLVRLAGVIVVLPIILRRFEPAEVAVWQLFASLMTLVLLMDLGLSPTFSRLLSFARGGARLEDMRDLREHRARITSITEREGEVEAARIYATLRWLYPRMALGAMLLFAILGTWALLKPVAACKTPDRAWLAWAVVLLGAGANFLGNGAGAALQGMNRIAVLRRWEVFTGMCQVLTAVLTVALGGDLLTLVVVYQLWAVINAWRNRALLAALEPALLATKVTCEPAVLSVLWPPTWRSGLGVLLSQGIIQASGLVYGQIADATTLAAYLLGVRIITMISQFSQAPFYSKLPQMATMWAAGERQQLLATAQRGMRWAQWVLVAGVLLAAYLLPPLLHQLHSQTPFVDPHVWALMGVAFLVERYGAMHLQLYSLTNHIIWHVANGLTGCCMLLLAWQMYPKLDLPALPLAMLIAYAGCYSTIAAFHSYKAFGINFFSFEARGSLLPFLTLIIGLAPAFSELML